MHNFIHYAPQTQSRQLKSSSSSSSYKNQQQHREMNATKRNRVYVRELGSGRTGELHHFAAKQQNKMISTTINKQHKPKSNATKHFHFDFEWHAMRAL